MKRCYNLNRLLLLNAATSWLAIQVWNSSRRFSEAILKKRSSTWPVGNFKLYSSCYSHPHWPHTLKLTNLITIFICLHKLLSKCLAGLIGCRMTYRMILKWQTTVHDVPLGPEKRTYCPMRLLLWLKSWNSLSSIRYQWQSRRCSDSICHFVDRIK